MVGWAVLRIVTSPVYAGLLRVTNSAGEKLVEGEHPGIVARAIWEELQESMRSRRSDATPRRNSAFILRGLLTCGGCGASMVGASTRKGATMYRYYRCLTRDKRGAAACPRGQVPAEPLETGVASQVCDRLRGAGLTGELVAGVIAAAEAEARFVEAELLAAARTASRLAAERHTLAGSNTSAAALEAAEQAEANAVAAHAQIVERSERLLERRDADIAVAQALEQLDVVWDYLTADNRARLLTAAVTRVRVSDTTFEVELAPLVARGGGRG